jgi:hypothetical protein
MLGLWTPNITMNVPNIIILVRYFELSIFGTQVFDKILGSW